MVKMQTIYCTRELQYIGTICLNFNYFGCKMAFLVWKNTSRSLGVNPIIFIILGQIKETVYIPPKPQNLKRLQICTWGTCKSDDMQILSTDWFKTGWCFGKCSVTVGLIMKTGDKHYEISSSWSTDFIIVQEPASF